MGLEYAKVLGELIDALRFQNINQPLSRRARHLLADLNRVTDGDVLRAIEADRARVEVENARMARQFDDDLRKARHLRD